MRVLVLALLLGISGCRAPLDTRSPQLVLAHPTRAQLDWQAGEIGLFIHFAPNTWTGLEGDDLSFPLERIFPYALDVEQWCDVADSIGASRIVFTAKHIGGFCWWPTETTDYCVRNIPWRNGLGDLLAELAAACKRRHLGLGLYLSPRDDYAGVGTGGIAHAAERQEAYDRLYRTQWTELFLRYDPLCELWLDGSSRLDLSELFAYHAPDAVVFQGPSASIRWVGNEAGFAPDPCWNAVPWALTAARWGTLTAADGDPNGDAWLPVECDARLRDAWFWNSRNADTIKSVTELMAMYEASVGRGAGLLLNVAPDTSGLIPSADTERLAEFGRALEREWGAPIDFDNGVGDVIDLELAQPVSIDRVSIQEDISRGERIRAWSFEALVEGEWRELARGQAIGNKRLARFEPVTTRLVRLRNAKMAATPIIKRLAVFAAPSADAPRP